MKQPVRAVSAADSSVLEKWSRVWRIRGSGRFPDCLRVFRRESGVVLDAIVKIIWRERNLVYNWESDSSESTLM